MRAVVETDWRVLPHGPVEALAGGVLRVEGDVPGMKIRRQMIVVVERDGLLVHNPMCLDEAAMASLRSKGEPTWVVVPSAFHRLDVARYRARFPGITVVTPRGARRRVSKVARVDRTYDEFGGTDRCRLEHLRGTKDREGVLLVEGADGVTLVFNDVVMNLPDFGGLVGAVYRWIGDSGRPAVTRLARLAIVSDRRALADHLRALADTPGLARVVPGHGAPIVDDPAGTLRTLADRLAAPAGSG